MHLLSRGWVWDWMWKSRVVGGGRSSNDTHRELLWEMCDLIALASCVWQDMKVRLEEEQRSMAEEEEKREKAQRIALMEVFITFSILIVLLVAHCVLFMIILLVLLLLL